MMRRLRRQSLTALLLGLHVAAVQGSLALHHHGGGPDEAPRDASSACLHAGQTGDSHDDCPVCHFLSQAQHGLGPDRVGREQAVREGTQGPSRITFPDPLARADRARAPPQG